MLESFNLFNHLNPRVQTSADGFQNSYGQFVLVDNHIKFNYFPAQYRRSTTPLRAFNAYAPRQTQVALKLMF
jgi:hypothetical protein